MSMVGKEAVPGVVGGGGAASRIMPGRAHSRQPQHHKTTHQVRETFPPPLSPYIINTTILGL